MHRTVLGLDVSQATLHAALLPAGSEQPAWQRVFRNHPDGFAKLLREVPPDAVWVLEPTGRYHRAVVDAALAAGRTVLCAEPKAAMLALRSRNPRAKTDRVDSLGLAWFARSRPLPGFEPRKPVIDELHDLLAVRKGLSLSRARLAQQAASLDFGTEHLQASIDCLSEQLRRVDARLAELCRSDETLGLVQRLQTVPGFGPVTASSLAARLLVGRFPRADSFVAYCGLDPKVRQSGRSAGRTKLSRQGDAELRRLLYLAALTACRPLDSPFREQFDRERDKQLSKTAAYCAVARKLATTAWSLHRHGTVYDSARVNTQPRPGAAPEPGGTSSA